MLFHQRVFARVCHCHDDRVLVAGFLDGRAVELHERRTLADLVACTDEKLEALAAELHRVDADVDEQFRAVRETQPDGVQRILHDHRDFGGGGRDDEIARRLDGDAVTHHLL